jgi:hypothetical protein
MLKKIFVTAAISLQFASLSLAQAQPPGATSAAPENVHKINQDKVRACRIEAASKGLEGQDLRAFIAQCAKA